jgi:hypothetical protein
MTGSGRERNLRGMPWLTMVIAKGDHPEHIAVVIEGAAKVVAPPQVPADVRAAATGDSADLAPRAEPLRTVRDLKRIEGDSPGGLDDPR